MEQPISVTLTEAERLEGKYSKTNVRRAIEGLNRDGVIYLADIVDVDHVEQMRVHMLEEAKALKAKKGDAVAGFNHGVATNFLQSPPLTTSPLFFEDMYANAFVHQIVASYLGPEAAWMFVTGNNALKNTAARQPVHKDSSFIHPLAPALVIANFPLSEFTPANGSTEFWLGTHATTTPDEQVWRAPYPSTRSPECFVRSELLEERRNVRPPIQIQCKPGGVLLRDQRIWHAGMPNASDQDRIMVGLMFQASWYPNDRKFMLPAFAREIMEAKPLAVQVQADYVDEAVCAANLHQWGMGMLPSDPDYRSLWEETQKA